MKVERQHEDRLAVRVETSAAPLVAETLDILESVGREALDQDDVTDREGARARLAGIQELGRQAREALGPVHVAGPERLVAEVVRGIASHAAYELDVLLEVLGGGSEPLSDRAIEEIRAKVAATNDAVEALIECEARRGDA